MIALLGGAGAGLVWGWLLGGRAPGRPSLQGMLVGLFASLVFAAEAVALAGWGTGGVLLASIAGGVVAYAGWRGLLRARYGTDGPEGGLFRA